MAKTASLNMRIDPGVKKAAAEVFARFGISVSDAVNIFLHKSVMAGGLPFDLRQETADQKFAGDGGVRLPKEETFTASVAPVKEDSVFVDDKTMAKIYESLAELTAEFDAEFTNVS